MLYVVFFWHSLNSSAILVHFEIKDLILSILFLSTLQEGRPYMEPEMHTRLLLTKYLCNGGTSNNSFSKAKKACSNSSGFLI